MKEKIKFTHNDEDIKNEEIKLKENLESEIDNNEQKNVPILLESKKNNKVGKNKRKASNIEDTDGALEDTKVNCFYDSDEGRQYY